MQEINLFHHTHIENLPAIIRYGGLGCMNALARRRVRYQSIAYPDIQQRRAAIQVPCGPGGTLHDYVPFFFSPRSPMLFALHKGNVTDHRGGQESIVHLVTTLEAVAAERECVFTDGHAIMKLSRYFDDLGRIDEILDWTVLDSLDWTDTVEDPDRSRRRQAELLVYGSCPWRLIQRVAVINDKMAEHVGRIIAEARHKPLVDVMPGWYY
jgi:hypothetical protein